MNTITARFEEFGLPDTLTADQCEAWNRWQAGQYVPPELLPTNGDTCPDMTMNARCGYPLLIDASCPNQSAHRDVVMAERAAPTVEDIYDVTATRQTDQPLHDWRLTGASNREAHGIVTTMLDQMDLNPPYQRGTVWTTDQRIALVKSWMMGVPIPALVLNDRHTPAWQAANGTAVYDGDMPGYVVVDGKQRLETAIAWFANRLAVPASWFPADRVARTEDTPDGPYVRYNGLTVVGRRFTKHRWHFPVIEAQLPTIQAEAELYLLVNGGGTQQSAQDMERAARVAGGAG